MAYAYWKGNPDVDPGRKDLLKCNVSEHEDWNMKTLYSGFTIREYLNLYTYTSVYDDISTIA